MDADTDIVAMPKTFWESNPHHLRTMDEYKAMYEESIRDPAGFWTRIARTFHWEADFEENEVYRFNFDATKGDVETSWFHGGKTNICYNAVDRWVEAGMGDRTAMLYEPNDEGEDPTAPQVAWTYSDVLEEVSRVANWLKSKGVSKGDVVSIFMPMIPHLPIAMLACARIGAVHSVVFGGFSAEAFAARIVDANSKVVITADGVMRGAKAIPLYKIAAEASEIASADGVSVDNMLVYQRLDEERLPVKLQQDRDAWWQDEVKTMDDKCPIEWTDSEDPLFLLYTSGSTGKPKGVEHNTGGYMVYAATTFKYIFNVHPSAGDVWFCTADPGWITGHSYVTYGPLLNGATQVIFEGVPTFPDVARLWRIVDKLKVTQFYTAPTAIRSLMRFGEEPVKATSRASLKVLGSVGEPINPEAWKWYFEVVGNGECPIMDTYWQTETGGIIMTPLPIEGWPMVPGSCTLPFFGIKPVLLERDGTRIADDIPAEGLLAIEQAWPSTIRGVFGDQKRLQETYFPVPGYYLTGDGCRRTEDGLHFITGRVDDVINVSGHRIGTAEIESAIVLHPKVSEAAAVGFPHDVKGEGIYVYVTLNAGEDPTEDLVKEMKMQVRTEIGPFATPDTVHWAPGLPKTRSGKIMRRILRKIAGLGKTVQPTDLGDTSTLADPSVVDDLISTYGH